MPDAAPRSVKIQPHAPLKTFRRSLTIFLLIPVAVLVLGLLVLVLLLDYPNPYTGSRFDSKRWIDAGSDQHFAPFTRSPMARDLVDNHLPRGLTESQVKSLLGEPENVRNQHFHSPSPGTHEYDYEIGPWSWHGWDAAFVVVYFDSEGKLTHAELGGY